MAQSLARNTTFLYIRMVVVLGISLITTRVILSNLGIEDYGIYNVVGSIVSLLTFLQTAMSSANYRFLAFAIGKKDERLLASTFKNALIISAVVGILVILFAETIGVFYINNYLNVPKDRFIAAFWTFQISAFTCVITTLYMPFFSDVISHERMDFFAYLSMFECVCKIVVAFLIASAPIDRLVYYALLLMCTQVVILIVYTLFCRINFKETRQFFQDKLSVDLLKDMFSFSGWTLFVTVADLCAVQGMNIVINLFFTPVVNAARGIAVQIQGAVDQFRGNLQTAFNPQITKRYAASETDGMYDLMYRSARYSSFILLIISLPIIFSVDDILSLWLNEVPQYTGIFVIITLIASIIDGVSNPFVTAIGATGNIRKFQTIVGFIKFLTLPACYFGVCRFCHPETVFVIYLIFTLITVIVRIYICSDRIYMKARDIFSNILYPILKYALISTLICYVVRCFITTDGFMYLVLYCFISVLLLTLSCYLYGLSTSEKSYIKNFVRRKIWEK